MKTFYDAIIQKLRGQGVSLFTFSFFLNLLLLATSIYMLQVYDRVLSSGSIDTLLWLTAVTIFAIAVYAILEIARKQVLMGAAHWFQSSLSAPVVQRDIEERLAGRQSPADISDVGNIRSFLASDAISAFLDAPWTPVFIAVIWMMHWVLGVIALGGAVVLFATALLNDRLTYKSQANSSRWSRRATQTIQNFIANAESLSALGMVNNAIGRWQKELKQVRDTGEPAENATMLLTNFSKFVRLGLQVAVLGGGAYLVLENQLTAGGMIAASIILSRALAPVERSIGAWRSYVLAYSSHKSLKELFARTPSEEPKRTKMPAPDGNLNVAELRYFPPGASDPVLKLVNFHLGAGEACGIIGPSGSGKTTLCRMLVGALRPNHGHVRLDGVDVADWPSEDRGPHIGYLPQTVELFPGSIRANIARFREASDEEVIAAAKRAGLHEMILGLPHGYDTQVDYLRDTLSGGERQRIGLARALFGDPRLIVLDEPNSNLDSDGEEALQTTLAHLKQAKRTVLIVSHRPSVLRGVDKILMMREGYVAEFGPREEVLSKMAQQRQAAVARAQGRTPQTVPQPRSTQQPGNAQQVAGRQSAAGQGAPAQAGAPQGQAMPQRQAASGQPAPPQPTQPAGDGATAPAPQQPAAGQGSQTGVPSPSGGPKPGTGSGTS